MGLLGQTSTVIINLGLQSDHAADTSIIDKVRRFFVRDAIAQTAPAAFSSIKVRVTATDIGVIEKEFNPYGTISLNVPAGNLRQFEVIAYVTPVESIAAISFRGTSIANLPAGETVTIPIVMILDETKLVIPDYAGQKIVIMDGLNGSALISKTATDIFDTGGVLRPYDIDFDSRGRIYFANYYAPDAGVFRMENINSKISDGTCTQIVDSSTEIRSIAIDRIRNILYYVNYSGDLYKLNLSGGSPTILFTSSVNQVAVSVCVDEASGMAYLAYMLGTLTRNPFISKYNPLNETPGLVPPAFPLNPYVGTTPAYDLIVKKGYLYISHYGVRQILQLPLSFSASTIPQTLSGKPGGSYPFYGPHMFIAVANRKLYFIDELEDSGLNTDEAIVSISGIDGSGWGLYPNSTGFFSYYSSC